MAILLIESPNVFVLVVSIAFRLRLYRDRVEQNGGFLFFGRSPNQIVVFLFLIGPHRTKGAGFQP